MIKHIEVEKTQKYIEKEIYKYIPILGLNLQKIMVVYREDLSSLMEISCTYPYYDPKVFFGNKAVERFIKNDLHSDRILHELCHILTDPLYSKSMQRFVSKDEIEDERERLTDLISLIIRRLLA